MTALLLTDIGRLWTGTPEGVRSGAAVVVEGERIAWVGPTSVAPAADAAYDCAGGLVTPGLVDAHTHPVYAGDRLAEIALRSAGAGYAEIAAAGGGIASTVAATRAAAPDVLQASVRTRLRTWLAGGATTVEVKTGYDLRQVGELAQVAMLAGLAADPELPRLSVTFLAAHAVPPEWSGRQDAYASEVATWSREAAAAGAENVDVFCDEGYFTVAESRRVLQAGAVAGLTPRIHADELARTGGSRLAAQLGVASADHLLAVDASDAEALAAAGVVAVVCPATALQLRRMPPVRTLLDAGVTLALASDHNPGQSGVTSMALVTGLAVAAFGLSVEEALAAASAGGAASLRRGDRGSVAVGQLGDLVLWDAPHEGAFAWAFGLRPRRVWRGGRTAYAQSAP